MNEPYQDDPELSRLLRSVRADADPVLWTRVRARIEARQHVPALVRWAMRPAALAASLALFVGAAGLALMLGTGTTVATGDQYQSIAEALVDDGDTEVQSPLVVPAPPSGAASDTGTAR